MIFLLVLLFLQTIIKYPHLFIASPIVQFYMVKIIQLCLGKEPRLKFTGESVLLVIGVVLGVLWEISTYINAYYILMHLKTWVLSKTNNTVFIFVGYNFTLILFAIITMKTMALLITIKKSIQRYKALYRWFERTPVNKILILKILNKLPRKAPFLEKNNIYNILIQIKLDGPWIDISPYRVLISNNELIIKNAKDEMSAYSSYAEFLKEFRNTAKLK